MAGSQGALTKRPVSVRSRASYFRGPLRLVDAPTATAVQRFAAADSVAELESMVADEQIDGHLRARVAYLAARIYHQTGCYAEAQRAIGLIASSEPNAEARLRLEILAGRLFRGARPIRLGERSLEVLCALALQGEMTREALAEHVWPTLDARAAANALKVCVYRLRAAAESKSIVHSTVSGYKLGPALSVDVHDIERSLRNLDAIVPLSEHVRSELERHVSALTQSSLAYLTDWEWAGSHVAYLETLRRAVLLLLSRDAFARRAWPGLDVLIARLLILDPCDEETYTLAIQAALSRSRPDIARRRYRCYRDAIARHLGIHEELTLRKLIDAQSITTLAAAHA